MNYLFQKNRELWLEIFFLVLILVLSVWNLPDFSNLMINADSYAILLPAKSLVENGTFSFRLGEYGDYFSPLFYRGGFSFVIAVVVKIFGGDFWLWAKNLIQISYIFTPIFVYLICKEILFYFDNKISSSFQRKMLAFLVALLMLFSYSFMQWSRVLMSEITTILLVAISFYFLLKGGLADRANRYLDISALIMGCALIFRFEMVVILIAFCFLLLVGGKKRWYEILFYFLISIIVWVFYFLWLYKTNLNSGTWLDSQMTIFYYLLGAHKLFLYFALSALIFLWLIWKKPYLSLIPMLVLGYIVYYLNFDFINELLPLISFGYHEILLVIGAFLGLIVVLWKNRKIFIFYFLAIVPLLFLYFSRGEYRYYVHLVMWLCILSVYCWWWLSVKIVRIKVLSIKIPLLLFIPLLIIGWQWYGSKSVSFLPEESYEQKVIQRTSQLLSERDDLISDQLVICSMFSEAIYYSIGLSSIDCFNGQSDILRRSGKQILVIVDEDVARNQIDFVKTLEEKYSNGLIKKEWLVTDYQEKNTVTLTKYPLRWYLIDNKL